MHIAKAAVQGEFGAKKFIKPLTHGHEVPAAVRSEGLQIRRPQGGVRDGEEPKKRGWGEI